jgi:TPR repeat protein
MEGIAHDASDPAPPKTGGVALHKTSRADSPEKGKLRVFISYSRDDLRFADQLNAALDACGFDCVMDRHGISGGEDWKRRLGTLISEADTVVFVLSPTSARSEICTWEVEEATRLRKRILPVNCQSLEGTNPPPQLRELNYIFFYEDPKIADSGFGTGLSKLIAALNTNFDWLREHTRYLQRATEWERGGRPANRLLSGDDIAEAKTWAARRPKNAPEPTALHLDFIRASEEEAEARSSAQRKQLDEIAAAQTEREAALRQAEEAQRKRATMARIRNIAFVLVSILACLATSAMVAGWWLYGQADRLRQVAEEQKAVAEEQRQQVDDILAGATNIFVKLQPHLDIDTRKEVFAVFRRGADHGDMRSMFNLAVSYFNGFGVAQDYAKAREWYEKAADKGEASAMVTLGQLYDNGQGVAQDYAKAREWYEKAADKGAATAMRNLGLFYANGRGLAQDRAKAREWYEKAADKGEASAMNDLGLLYDNGQGVAQDYTKAREWYEKAAVKGDANAMVNLGVLYDNGRGVAQDYVKAREWYEKAAAKDNASAMFNLGLHYDNGQGVAHDYAKAREWYEKAADKGQASAITNLGFLYANGRGVAQDYAKAREWYEKAADKGEATAMRNLGVLYDNGQGVAQDYAKAREWYEKAASKRNANAMLNLGELYRDGHGVAQDYAKAREWYEKAANKGDATAKVRLEELAILEAGGVKKELGDPR